MKREDITRIFEGATKQQIDDIMAINGADIKREQDKAQGTATKLQTDLDTANAALTKANETIKTLEANQGDTKALQAEIDRYKAEKTQRKQAEQEAAALAQLEQRFNAVTGERKFIHEFVRKGVMEDFGKAIADKANVGKSDADVFAALVKDQNYFASQNPPAAGGMPAFGANMRDESDLNKMSDADYYATVLNKNK